MKANALLPTAQNAGVSRRRRQSVKIPPAHKHEDFVICRDFFPPFFEKKKFIKLATSRPRQFLESHL
jgi:hypothetical protein